MSGTVEERLFSLEQKVNGLPQIKANAPDSEISRPGVKLRQLFKAVGVGLGELVLLCYLVTGDSPFELAEKRPELWVNILDLGAFIFVTPELLNNTRHADKMTVFAQRLKDSVLHVGNSVKGEPLLVTLVRQLVNLFMVVILLTWGLDSVSGWTGFDPRAYMIGKVFIFAFKVFGSVFGFVIMIWLFLSETGKYMFVLGLLLFTIARAMAIVHSL